MNYVLGPIVITPELFFILWLSMLCLGLTGMGLYIHFLIRNSRNARKNSTNNDANGEVKIKR